MCLSQQRMPAAIHQPFSLNFCWKEYIRPVYVLPVSDLRKKDCNHQQSRTAYWTPLVEYLGHPNPFLQRLRSTARSFRANYPQCTMYLNQCPHSNLGYHFHLHPASSTAYRTAPLASAHATIFSMLKLGMFHHRYQCSKFSLPRNSRGRR